MIGRRVEMPVRVREVEGGFRIDGDWAGVDSANAFLAHLTGRGFSPATVRAYAFDVVNRSEERRVGKECRSRWSPYH